MGIIEDYLKTEEAPKPEVKKKASELSEPSDFIKQYLKSSSDDVPTTTNEKLVPAGAPIGGQVEYITESERNKRVKDSEKYYGTRDFPSLGGKIADEAVAGGNEALSGVSDILSNKPASGAGKVGTGLLRAATSIPVGTGEFVGEVTGNKDLGNKIPLIFGAVPVAKVSSSLNVGGGSTAANIINKLPVPFANKLPKNVALKKIVEDIGPEKAAYVSAEMKSNPRLTPADLSDSVRIGTQKLYAGVEGPHVNYLGDVTRKRLETAAADLEQHMNANLGNVVNPADKIDSLMNKIKSVGTTEINPVVKSAKPVDLTDTIKNIDNILKPGVNSVVTHDAIMATPALEARLEAAKKYLTDGESVLTDAEKLNRIQSMFRSAGEKLVRAGGQGALEGEALLKIRQDIISAIDKSSNGKYRPALSKYRDEFNIKDAFEHGHDTIMDNSKKLKDRPEFFERWIKNATDHELEAAREGARIAYDTQMNAFKHAARRGTDIGDVEFNRRRMTALFGKEEAERMFKTFEDAKKVAATNNKLVEGSQTQMRNVQNSYFEPYNPAKASNPASTAINVGLPIAGEVAGQFLGGGVGLGGAATAIGLAGLKGLSAGASKTKTAIIQKLERERNLKYAKYALPEGETRAELIQALDAVANAPPKQSIMRRASSLASRAIPP